MDIDPVTIKAEKQRGYIDEAEEEDDVDIGLESEFISHPSPIDDMDKLNEEQQEMLNLLRSMGMAYFFDVFDDEQIYLKHLRLAQPQLLASMLHSHFKYRKIIEFLEKVKNWKKNEQEKDTPQEKGNNPPSKKKPIQDDESTDDDTTAKGKYPPLRMILSRNPQSAKFNQSYQLTNTNRKILLDTVVHYFFDRGLPFTQDVRDNMAKQIRDQFMEEDQYYYSDNGLMHGGQDKFYSQLRYLTDRARKPRKMRRFAQIDEATADDPTNDENSHDSMPNNFNLRVSSEESLDMAMDDAKDKDWPPPREPVKRKSAIVTPPFPKQVYVHHPTPTQPTPPPSQKSTTAPLPKPVAVVNRASGPGQSPITMRKLPSTAAPLADPRKKVYLHPVQMNLRVSNVESLAETDPEPAPVRRMATATPRAVPLIQNARHTYYRIEGSNAVLKECPPAKTWSPPLSTSPKKLPTEFRIISGPREPAPSSALVPPAQNKQRVILPRINGQSMVYVRHANGKITMANDPLKSAMSPPAIPVPKAKAIPLRRMSFNDAAAGLTFNRSAQLINSTVVPLPSNRQQQKSTLQQRIVTLGPPKRQVIVRKISTKTGNVLGEPYVVHRTTPTNLLASTGTHPQVRVVGSLENAQIVRRGVDSPLQPPTKIRVIDASQKQSPTILREDPDPLQLEKIIETEFCSVDEIEKEAEEPTGEKEKPDEEQEDESVDKTDSTASAPETEIQEVGFQFIAAEPEEKEKIPTKEKEKEKALTKDKEPIVSSFEDKEGVSFMKSDCFQGLFDKSLTSCNELNKKILSADFEKQLNMTNKFRTPDFCEDFVRRTYEVIRRNTRFNIEKLQFHDQLLGSRLTISLFLLPAVLNPAIAYAFHSQWVNSFISVAPSVQEFIEKLPKKAEGPFVAIIGRLLSPLSFVVFYQRKVYRCVELWHALDMAIKIFIVYQKSFPSDCATAWQFIMLHFYEMEQEIKFILPGVLRLRAMLNITSMGQDKLPVQAVTNSAVSQRET